MWGTYEPLTAIRVLPKILFTLPLIHDQPTQCVHNLLNKNPRESLLSTQKPESYLSPAQSDSPRKLTITPGDFLARLSAQERATAAKARNALGTGTAGKQSWHCTWSTSSLPIKLRVPGHCQWAPPLTLDKPDSPQCLQIPWEEWIINQFWFLRHWNKYSQWSFSTQKGSALFFS